MRLRVDTIAEDAFTQSFAMQFISLMLFILIFTVASFIPKLSQKNQEAEASVKAESLTPDFVSHVSKPEKPILHETLDGSFFTTSDPLGAATEIQPERWSALFSLLFQHDLSLKLILPTSAGMSVAVMKAPQFLEQLIRAGVPSTAVRIELNKDSSVTAAEVEIVEGETLAW